MATTIVTRDGVRGRHVVAPLESTGDALPGQPVTLSFDNGLSRLHLAGDPELPELFVGRFADPLPLVWAREGTIHVKYPLGARLLGRIKPNSIRINPRVPWSIDVHGDADHLSTDLTGVDLRAFTVHGDASHVQLTLGPPAVTCTIRLGSGNALHLRRPGDVPVRVQVATAATKVMLEDRWFATVRGGLADQTPGYDTTHARYLVIVSGAVTDLTVKAA